MISNKLKRTEINFQLTKKLISYCIQQKVCVFDLMQSTFTINLYKIEAWKIYMLNGIEFPDWNNEQRKNNLFAMCAK